jgi:hypothetical protein
MRHGMFKALVSVFLLALLALTGALVPTPRTLMAQGPAVGKAVSRNVSASKSYGTHFQTSDRCVHATTASRPPGRGHFDRGELANEHDGQRGPRPAGWRGRRETSIIQPQPPDSGRVHHLSCR